MGRVSYLLWSFRVKCDKNDGNINDSDICENDCGISKSIDDNVDIDEIVMMK